MFDSKLLGRYEYIDPAANSHKFWHIVLDKDKMVCHATWGRIGNNSPPATQYDIDKAAKKIKEKLRKGYVKVNGYSESTGNLSTHFCEEILEEMRKG